MTVQPLVQLRLQPVGLSHHCRQLQICFDILASLLHQLRGLHLLLALNLPVTAVVLNSFHFVIYYLLSQIVYKSQ